MLCVFTLLCALYLDQAWSRPTGETYYFTENSNVVRFHNPTELGNALERRKDTYSLVAFTAPWCSFSVLLRKELPNVSSELDSILVNPTSFDLSTFRIFELELRDESTYFWAHVKGIDDVPALTLMRNVTQLDALQHVNQLKSGRDAKSIANAILKLIAPVQRLEKSSLSKLDTFTGPALLLLIPHESERVAKRLHSLVEQISDVAAFYVVDEDLVNEVYQEQRATKGLDPLDKPVPPEGCLLLRQILFDKSPSDESDVLQTHPKDSFRWIYFIAWEENEPSMVPAIERARRPLVLRLDHDNVDYILSQVDPVLFIHYSLYSRSSVLLRVGDIAALLPDVMVVEFTLQSDVARHFVDYLWLDNFETTRISTVAPSLDEDPFLEDDGMWLFPRVAVSHDGWRFSGRKLSTESIVAAVQSRLNNPELYPYARRSEAIPQEQPGPSYELVGSTFTEVLGRQRESLVFFYAPWCVHSQKIFRTSWLEVAERLQQSKMLVGHINAFNNDLFMPQQKDNAPASEEKISVDASPTIMLFQEGGRPIVYRGENTASSILEFVYVYSLERYVRDEL